VSRFLFTVPPAWGHIAPTVALAQELQARGHTVAYAAHPAVAGRLAAAGLDLLDGYAWGDRMLEAIDLLQRGRHEAAVGWKVGNVYLERLGEAAAEHRALLSRWRPDVTVNDILCHSAALSAEAEGVPQATSCPIVLPHWISPGLPPYGFGFAPDPDRSRGWPLAGLLSRLLRGLPRWQVNRIRRRLGLAPRKEPFLGLSEQLVLAYTTEALEYARPGLPDQVHYLGPSISGRRGDHDLPFPWDWLDGSPLVSLSLGTIFHGHRPFFEAAAEASRGQPWQLVMKVASHLPSGPWPGGPPNVLAVHEQPQLALLKRARAMVSHAGDNSVNEALSEGVPLVLAPAGGDQADVARRVVEAGAGIQVPLRAVSAPQLREAIRRVLGEPSFRARAQAIATDFARCDGPATGAGLLEQLATTQKPVRRAAGAPPTCHVRPAP
jgi:MGT family glycosyltransferase